MSIYNRMVSSPRVLVVPCLYRFPSSSRDYVHRGNPSIATTSPSLPSTAVFPSRSFSPPLPHPSPRIPFPHAGRRCASVRPGARAHCCCLPRAPLRATLAPLLRSFRCGLVASRPHIQTWAPRADRRGQRPASGFIVFAGIRARNNRFRPPPGSGLQKAAEGMASGEPVPFTLRRPSVPPSAAPGRPAG